MPVTAPAPWWRGARGEWWVAGQGALMALLLFGPRGPSLPLPAPVSLAAGVLLMAPGLFLFAWGLLALGRRNLTPLPAPRAGGALVETGPYRLVRHPIYGGGAVFALGWALFVHGWLTLAFAAVLFLFIDLKARREERWLLDTYPGYPEYCRRVRKLIPFIY